MKYILCMLLVFCTTFFTQTMEFEIFESLQKVSRSLFCIYFPDKEEYKEEFRRILYAESSVRAASYDVSYAQYYDASIRIAETLGYLEGVKSYFNQNLHVKETIKLNQIKLTKIKEDLENLICDQ